MGVGEPNGRRVLGDLTTLESDPVPNESRCCVRLMAGVSREPNGLEDEPKEAGRAAGLGTAAGFENPLVRSSRRLESGLPKLLRAVLPNSVTLLTPAAAVFFAVSLALVASELAPELIDFFRSPKVLAVVSAVALKPGSGLLICILVRAAAAVSVAAPRPCLPTVGKNPPFCASRSGGLGRGGSFVFAVKLLDPKLPPKLGGVFLTAGSTSGRRVTGLIGGAGGLGRAEKLSLLPAEKPDVTEATLSLTDAVVADAAFLTDAAVDEAAFFTEAAVDEAMFFAPPRKSSRPFLVLSPTALTVSPTRALTLSTTPTWPRCSSATCFLVVTDWMTANVPSATNTPTARKRPISDFEINGVGSSSWSMS